ncbi:diguanylate cyclase [Candidatus Woesearchaeota archaeon]|nr:diguanylate cyclase [Candidatus Woesearchaeota archaeon]
MKSTAEEVLKMGISEDLSVDDIVESVFSRFNSELQDMSYGFSRQIVTRRDITSAEPTTPARDISYKDHLKDLMEYSQIIGSAENIIKSYCESLVELDLMPRGKFLDVKRGFVDKTLDEYFDRSIGNPIMPENFETEEGKHRAMVLHDYVKSIKEQRMVSLLGAVKNSKIKQLKEGSVKDGLTGIHNRRYLNERISDEVERAKRKGDDSYVSLIMFDIDDFTAFNTQYGHLVGDKVLKYAAEALYAENRKTDTAARYGGEEFALLLPETDEKGAEDVALQKLQSMRSYVIRKLREEDKVYIDDITFSAGVSTFGEGAPDPDSMITNADDALYLAKNEGKNRVEMFKPSKRSQYTKARKEYKAKK